MGLGIREAGKQKPVVGKMNAEAVLKLALLILLAVQICLIAYSNLTMIGQNLDCDTGKLFGHIAEMWKRKALFLENWDYMTTMEFDCSSLLALPFYAVTGDIVLSFGLANIVFLAGFIGLIFFLFKGEDRLYPLFCVNVLLIPFKVGMLDYYNMMFFGGAQYIIKTAIPILMIGLLVSMDRAHQAASVKTKVLMAVCLGLIFITSLSSGIYVALCGLLPVFAAYAVWKFFKWERAPWGIIILAVLSCVLILVGWRLNASLMGGARGNGMTLCSVYQMLASVSGCLWGIFELFGGVTAAFDIQVLSPQGIQILAKCCLVVTLLGAGSVYAAKCLKKQGDLRGVLLLTVFFWNLFVLIIAFPRGGSDTYEYRYHLIGALPLVCAAGAFLIDGVRRLPQGGQRIILWAASYLAICFLCLCSYRDLYSRGEQNADLKEMCAYVKELDVEYIYLYDGSNDSDICRVIDESSTYLCLMENGLTWAYDNYKEYVGAPMQTDRVVVVVDNEKYDFGDAFEIAGHALTRFDTVANRSLYVFGD
ncbi:MAG: hypothetical protein NC543_12740 [bacterium]|nr:hypothetical protein [bacterium]MCM1374740.1 hypothetical protein [Muribaculum sp.]